jgi:hypothetical protein
MLTTDGDTDSATSVSAVSNATARDRASSSTVPLLGDADAVPNMVRANAAPSAMSQDCRSVVRNMNIPPFVPLTLKPPA